MITDLTYPAPRRESVATADGKFYTRPWTETGVREAKQGGAWFLAGHHEFESIAVAKLAGVRE